MSYIRKIFPMAWTKGYSPEIHTHRDTQGPCPNQFHIGTQQEWTAIKGIMASLGIDNKEGYQTYLKFPSAYYLNRSNGAYNSNYGVVRFWTSTATNRSTAYCFYINEKNAVAVATDKPANGFSIRPFLDYSLTPPSNVTVLIGSIASGGVLWSKSSGLLFLSADGNSWTIIADKNLGATEVWDGTNIEESRGLYYQFGNNYGFAVNPTTISTAQDVTGYGPGNYYSSSNFIATSNNYWTTADNNNIRGGTTNGTWTDN